jgi:polysaccharide biosynthesis protein PslG
VRRLPAAAAAAGLLLALAPASHAATPKVPNGFFGVTWDGPAAVAAESEQDRQFALMARSGVESVRAVFSWSEIEPTSFVYDFRVPDALVARAARHRLRLLPVVLNPPAYAQQEPAVEGSPPRDPQDYARLLSELVRRYGPSGSFWLIHPELPKRPLREWQIWNEPHLDGYWNTPGDSWVGGYAQLLAAAKRAIEQEDPGARVVLAALADFSWRHLARLYAAGARRDFDAASINLYTSRPEFVLRGVRRFRMAMNRRRERRKPLYLTEVGWPASLGRMPRPEARWQRAWETTDGGVARRIRRFFRMAVAKRRRLGLSRVYWYNWSSSYRAGSIFNFMGLTLFDGERFEVKPALRAFRAGAGRYGRR